MPDRKLAILFAIVVAGVSVLATFQPSLFQFIKRVPNGDKLGHFVLMGLMAFFAVMAFSHSWVRGKPLGPVWCVAVVLLLITIDEALQLTLRYRTFSFLDLIWSYAGAISFGSVAAWLAKRSGTRSAT